MNSLGNQAKPILLDVFFGKQKTFLVYQAYAAVLYILITVRILSQKFSNSKSFNPNLWTIL